MSQFLWIEDFQSDGENVVSSFTEAIFGEILTKQPEDTKQEVKKTLEDHRVLLECTFLDGFEFIRDPEKLFQVDYIILDVDLIIQEDIDENNSLPDILELYSNEPGKEPEEALKEVAGYQLYIELVMGLDFPKDHILFCSNHIEQLESLKDAFTKAKIQLPLIPGDDKLALSKDEPDREALRGWIRERRDNPYSMLRRGIIEGCQQVQKSLISDDIPFRQFCTKKNRQNVTAQNMHDYLETLLKFLPRREPSEAKSLKSLYKLFVRTLSHEWEDDFNPDNLKPSDISDENILKRQRMFGWIIKCTRNWTAHSKIFDNLSEQEVAFLFIIAMRAMFKLSDKTEDYETLLLNLFADKLPKLELKKQIEHPDVLLSHCSKSYSQLFETYVKVLNKKGKSPYPYPAKQDKLFFSSILQDLQYSDQNNEEPFDYVTGLFQIFWQNLSPIKLKSFTPTQNHQQIVFEYEFDLNDYSKEDQDSFLFEFARSIYKRSFADYN